MMAFMALDELDSGEQVAIARNCLEITDKVPELDAADALTLLHKLGRYFNENPGVKDAR
jgi:hypothetical protein